MRRLLILIMIIMLSGCVHLKKMMSPEDFMEAAEKTEGTAVSSLTEDTSPDSADNAYTIDDMAGTPTSKRASWGNIITKAHGLSDGMVKVSSSTMATAVSGTDYALPTRKLDDFGTPDDNTDLDATTSYHGLLPKLGGGTTNFLRADGSWAAPPGSGGYVDISGTPSQYEWATWVDNNTMQGVSVTGNKVACTDSNGEPVACTNLTDVNYLSELKDDTTPQLGGNLDIQSFDIEGVDATEFGYLDGVTGDIQTALDARCLESVFGTAISTGLLLDGTDLKVSATLQEYHGVNPSAFALTTFDDADAPTFRATISAIGADEKFVMGATIQETSSADTTPDVSNAATGTNNIYRTNANGTITDFDDADDHDEFSDGDFFLFIVDDASSTIDFSENSNIEGNAGVDFTGSATDIVTILFVYYDARWNAVNFTSGFSTPTSMSVDTIQAKMGVTTDASGGRAIAASEMNGVIYLTDDGPFDVDIPDGQCDAAADVGTWVTVMTDADDQASLTSNDASNHFINDDLTDFGAGDELDIDGNSVTVMCIAAEYWKVTGWTGAQPTDGGAAD